MERKLTSEQLRRLAELDWKIAASQAGYQGAGLDVFDDPETGVNLVGFEQEVQTVQPTAVPKPAEQQLPKDFAPNAFGKTGESHPHANGRVVYDPQARY